jgi:dUTPase
MPLTLYIQPTNPAHAQHYRAAAIAYNNTPYGERNSGFDLYMDTSDTQDAVYGWIVGQGCHAVAMEEPQGTPRAFWLAPRSSIVKTRWRLANSLGLIDATYRGIIRAGLSSVVATTEGPSNIDEKQRYVQLAAPSLEPWAAVVVVDVLPAPASARGIGGFGSTGAA